MSSTLVRISEISVGKRHRQDDGDLAALAKSIRDLGFLNPVAITPDNRLIHGARRLKAARELGLNSVPVTIIDSLSDAIQMLKAERDENTCRKDFAPTEAVSLGRELEELERPKARARQAAAGPKEGRGKKSACGKLPQANGEGKTRDKVAGAVGMSPRTYDKAKEVVQAAESAPALFGDLPQQMDKSGKVDGAHKEMKRRKGNSPASTPTIGPKESTGEEDARKFIDLRNRLYPRWTTEWDKQVIRQCLRQLANEV